MKQFQRNKIKFFKKLSLKPLFLLLAIALIASFFIWLQFQPTTIEKTIDKPVLEEEDVIKKVVQELDPVPKVEPKEPKESEVTYVNPPTQPIKVEDRVEERVEERDQDAVLASALPKVYTIYTDSEQGSGFLFNDKGDIVTNAHVVDGFNSVTVTNNTGQHFVGQVIVSHTIDVALIESRNRRERTVGHGFNEINRRHQRHSNWKPKQ
jgi:S1-C subfamily serine protease